MSELKVALVHDYLTQYGGAERVLDAIHSIFPDATVFTSIYYPKAMPDHMASWDIRTTEAQNLPLLAKLSKHYTFLYPFLFEAFDLRDYDLIISDWSAWSKGVITNPKQLHISYCHCPPRFLYKYSGESQRRNNWYYKPIIAYLDNYLRVWDYFSAQRPNYLLTNSQNVRQRINKFYRRDAIVMNPPLKLTRELILPEGSHKFDTSYYLMVARLEEYKNIDIAIEAFNDLEMPLRIVGSGKDEARLKKLARGNIAFVGRVDDRELAMLYQNCRGFISAVADEDLGIVPLEAMSYGKPVLAHRSGGLLETIEEGKTGMFFDTADAKSLIEALKKFDLAIQGNVFDSTYLKESVKKYDEEIFKANFKQFVMQKWQESMLQSAHA